MHHVREERKYPIPPHPIFPVVSRLPSPFTGSYYQSLPLCRTHSIHGLNIHVSIWYLRARAELERSTGA